METVYIGFKGAHNASCRLVQTLPGNRYFLTNSFDGLNKDMDALDGSYGCAILFGVDKNLTDAVRIEKAARCENGSKLYSLLNLERISERLTAANVKNTLSDEPTPYLCNEAYRAALQKFGGKAILIHIPTIKYADDAFIQRIKQAFWPQSLLW